MHSVFVGLGSNLGDPIRQVEQAIEELNEISNTQLVRYSPWYSSVAIGPTQPDFINGVAQLYTGLSPLGLLDALQAIEQLHRRVRKEHWGPRTLDLDILLWNSEQISSERLSIPHPYMEERSFVLLPLFDIAPDITLPNGKSLAALVNQCDQNGITRHSQIDPSAPPSPSGQ